MKHYLCLEEKRLTYICGRCGADGFVISKADCAEIGAEGMEEALNRLICSGGLRNRRMVVSGTDPELICKELRLPKLSRRLTWQIISNEIAYSRENRAPLAADLDILPPGADEKERHVLAYAVSRDKLERKMGELRRAGVRCERFLVLRDCMARLACWYKKDSGAVVMAELEENQVYLHLVMGGHCLLSRHIRLNVRHFCEENAREFLYRELADQIRKLLQFYSKRNGEDTVKGILLLPGSIVSAEEAAACIQEILGLPVDCLKPRVSCARGTGSLELSVYGRVLAVCAADQQFKRRETPDLIRAGNRGMLTGRGLCSVGRGAGLLLLAGVNGAVLMGLWLYTRAGVLDTEGMIREHTEYMQEGDRQARYQEYLDQQKLASAKGDMEQSMRRQEGLLRETKRLSMEDYRAIADCLDGDMGLEAMAYSSQTGSLDVTISMPDPGSAPELVEQLRRSGHFPEVSHSLWQHVRDAWEQDRIDLDISSLLNAKEAGDEQTQ